MRILIVEDDPSLASGLSRILQAEGYAVDAIGRGEDAVFAASQERFDLVILDIGLPRMDGFEVARRLRQRPESRRARLVAITGYGREEDRRHSREVGFDHHLTKPVNPRDLVELLTHADARG